MKRHKYLKKKKKQLSQHGIGQAWQGRNAGEGQEVTGSIDSRAALAPRRPRAAPPRPSLHQLPTAQMMFAAAGSSRQRFAFGVIY